MNTQLIQQNINQLPLHEQMVLLENALQTVKEKVFTQIENTDARQMRVIFKVLQLNSEMYALHNVAEQLPSVTFNKVQNFIKVIGDESYEQHIAMLKEKYKHLPIVWGKGKPDPDELFGIWKDKNITLEQIREKAWKRK